MRNLLALLGCVLLLAACDPARVAKLEEGVSTEAQVRQQFGEPVTVTVLPDGQRVLDYPRQPEGWTNYRITIGADGKMTALRQLLHADNLPRCSRARPRCRFVICWASPRAASPGRPRARPNFSGVFGPMPTVRRSSACTSMGAGAPCAPKSATTPRRKPRPGPRG